MFQPSLGEVRKAAAKLAPYIRKTPLLRASSFDRVFLKAESLQLTGSFKIRTALHQILQLSAEDRRRGVVTSSSGNFAQGAAMAGKLLKVDTTIVMMESSNALKVARTRSLGGRVVFCENDFYARQETVDQIRETEGRVEIHPYDHPAGITGNATIALELVADLPDFRDVAVPISGGGLIAGIASALKRLRPGVCVWGVQPRCSNAAQLSFQARRRRSVSEPNTIADGLRVSIPGKITFPLILEAVDQVVTVGESSIRAAVGRLLWDERLVVEPSGAVTLAAIGEGLIPQDRTVLILSGGNVAPELLSEIVDRGPLQPRSGASGPPA